MTTVALAGCTGLTGSHILSTLTNLSSISSIYAFTRRDLSNTSPKLHPIISTDTSKWPTQFRANTPIMFSALGTTRAAAGGLENQRKIDHDLPVSLAKAAKDSGCKVFVLISSSGANKNSMIPYSKMKGETEAAVTEMEFEHVVIVRPGLIVGDRRAEESRPTEFAFRKLAGFLGGVGNVFKDFWAQDVDVIAKAAVSAGLQCLEGKKTEKVWILNGSDIIRLGRTEWKD